MLCPWEEKLHKGTLQVAEDLGAERCHCERIHQLQNNSNHLCPKSSSCSGSAPGGILESKGKKVGKFRQGTSSFFGNSRKESGRGQGPMSALSKNEEILRCEPMWLHSKALQSGCSECGAMAYRVLTIKTGSKAVRSIKLCGRHFLEMLRTVNEAEKRKMSG